MKQETQLLRFSQISCAGMVTGARVVTVVGTVLVVVAKVVITVTFGAGEGL